MRRGRRVCRGGDRDRVGGQTNVWRAYLPSGLPRLQGREGKAGHVERLRTVVTTRQWREPRGLSCPKAPATPRGSRALGGSPSHLETVSQTATEAGCPSPQGPGWPPWAAGASSGDPSGV